MTYKQTQQELGRLHRILDAGEKGYAISAVNVNNRGLKVLLKSFAQQRTRFKAEIRTELQRLGGETSSYGGLLPAIHRGRINIFAALTISQDEREKAVMKEILLGERFAISAYRQALKQDLLLETREMIERQLEEIKQVVEQIRLVHGKEGKKLVVRLFESMEDAEKALLDIKWAGLHLDMVEHLDFDTEIEIYKGKTNIVAETIVSGAVGGAFWGGLIGVLAGIGMQAASMAPFETATGQSLWANLALAGIFAGQFVGSILGFAIGVGLSGEDAYQYNMGLKRGKVLLMAMVDVLQAPEAGQIMSLVNIGSRDLVKSHGPKGISISGDTIQA